MPTQQQSPTPRCALHPEREALETCGRCGNYLCAICMSSDEGKIVCTACVTRNTREGRSRRAIIAPIVSAVACGLAMATLVLQQPLACLSLPLGFIGLGLSLTELGLIRDRIAPTGGRPGAWAGVVLGLVALLGGIAVLVLTPRR